MDCKACHKPLRELNWNKGVSILICDDYRCPMYRTPQGTTVNIGEIAEVNEDDGRKTKKLRGAKVESARRKSKTKRRVGQARKDGSQKPGVDRRSRKVAPGKRKAVQSVH